MARFPQGIGPREWSPRKSYPHVGKGVVLRREVDRYPDFLVPAGMTGVIVAMESDFIRVKMDRLVKGAEEWDNEIHWFEDLVKDFEKDVEILSRKEGKQ